MALAPADCAPTAPRATSWANWWVSHEAINQEFRLQCRGSLRAELTDSLRTVRARRRCKGLDSGKVAWDELQDIVSISERPAKAKDRAVPGHWEDGLIRAQGGKSKIVLFVKRTTWFTLLVPMPTGRKFHTLRDAIAANFIDRPEHLRHSFTSDEEQRDGCTQGFRVRNRCRRVLLQLALTLAARSERETERAAPAIPALTLAVSEVTASQLNLMQS